VPGARKVAQMSDAELAEQDERFVRANLENWREAGMSEAEIEDQFSTFTPPIKAAYYRMTHGG
jgi:hypothetical protein